MSNDPAIFHREPRERVRSDRPDRLNGITVALREKVNDSIIQVARESGVGR